MKNITYIKTYSLILLLILSFTGCKKEYKTTTKINSDGSCDRIVVARMDSTSIQSSSFPLPGDTSWDIQYKIPENDTQKVFIARKYFSDINQINDEYRNKNKVAVEIKFEKKFRWFFTYLNYRETYKSYNQFNRIPLKSFLNKDEYNRYEAGDTSNSMKEKLNSYFRENLFDDFYSGVLNEVQKANDPLLPVNLFTARKQEIKDSLFAGSGETKSILKSLERVLNTKHVLLLEPCIEKKSREIDAKIDLMSETRGEYTNNVIMPGIILNTNADAIEGNKATWKFNESKFCYSDVNMVVESRITNIWTIYLTGGLVLIIVVLLVLSKFRNRKV